MGHNEKEDQMSAAQKQMFDEFQMINEKAIDTANVMLKSAVLMGAAVAVLSFVSSFADNPEVSAKLMAGIAGSLVTFSWGVGVAVLAIGFAYLAHYSALAVINSNGSRGLNTLAKTIKVIFHVLAIIMAFSSLYFFVSGVYGVQDAVLFSWSAE